MNIVHIETGRHLYGGAQQVLFLCRGLLDNAVGTTLVCQRGSMVDGAARDLQIPVENIACNGDLDVGFYFRLRKFLSGALPDLVHSHSRRGADVMGGRAAASVGVPAILTRRVDSIDSALVARLRYSHYEKIIAISENVAAAVRRSGIDDERVAVIRSAVEPIADACDREHWDAEFGLDERNVVAVVAAQLIKRKGHRFLIDALPDLCSAHPEFRLLILGVGPLDRALRRQVTSMGLDDHVQFAGFRPDLDRVLGCADLLVHPATAEGLGVAMLKAASAGLPVVAFAIAGAREAVVHGETGMLVTPKDVRALLQALLELVENPEKRQLLGRAGRARMAKEFTVNEMLSRYMQLYGSLVDD